MKTRSLVAIIAALLLMTGAVVAAPPPTPEIPRWVIAGGGGHAEAGIYALDFTIGQPVVGGALGGDKALGAGFWATGHVALEHDVFLPLTMKGG